LAFGFTAVHVPVLHSLCASQTESSPAAQEVSQRVPPKCERYGPHVSVPTETGPPSVPYAQQTLPPWQFTSSRHSHAVEPLTGHVVVFPGTHVDGEEPLGVSQHVWVSVQ